MFFLYPSTIEFYFATDTMVLVYQSHCGTLFLFIVRFWTIILPKNRDPIKRRKTNDFPLPCSVSSSSFWLFYLKSSRHLPVDQTKDSPITTVVKNGGTHSLSSVLWVMLISTEKRFYSDNNNRIATTNGIITFAQK